MSETEEIIPDEVFNNSELDWAKKAFDEGNFFTVAIDRIKALERFRRAAEATVNGEIYEELAAIQHDIWASWQKYVHDHKLRRVRIGLDTSYTLSVKDVERWNRQIITPYADLTENEKDSDREQVDKFWHLICGLQGDKPDE